ncbi:MAG TPA: hypothetical protein VKY56_01855 [Chloroflexota bacterium]|nr:hypothetical protein [Chloroflexota bacterium]
MLDRERVRELLGRLDWSRGMTRDDLLRALLDANIGLPNELISALPPTERFASPDDLLGRVPDTVWTIHREREERARGWIRPPEAAERAH